MSITMIVQTAKAVNQDRLGTSQVKEKEGVLTS